MVNVDILQQKFAYFLRSRLSPLVSYFSATLGDIMREQELTQAVLAEKSKVPQGNISLYLRDESRPSQIMLTRLCLAVGDDSIRLAVAFLRDEVPEPFVDRIEISGEAGEKPRERSKDPFAKFSTHLREFLADAGRECDRRPEVLTALQAVFKVVKAD